MAVERFMTARQLQIFLLRDLQKIGYNEADDEPILDQTGNQILDQGGRQIFSD